MHFSLKQRYARDPSQLERKLDQYVVDVVLEDRLVEIQTSGFWSLRKKIAHLLKSHCLTLVFPIAKRKTICKVLADGSHQRRLSPKRGNIFDVFAELVSIPSVLEHPNFVLDVVLIHEEEVRKHSGSTRRGWRRRGWLIQERKLIEVYSTTAFSSMYELYNLLEPKLPDRFTTEDLAHAMGRNRSLAQKAAYCFRLSNVIESVSKQGNSLVYRACSKNPEGAN